MKCSVTGYALSTAYTKEKCRCEDCVQWNADRCKAKRPNYREADRLRNNKKYQELKDDPNFKAAKKIAQQKYFSSTKGKAAMYRAVSKRQDRYDSWIYFWTEDNYREFEILIEERDRLTQETGEQHHIDHIVPLCMGGPHHPANCRVITATENLSRPKDGSDLA